MMNEREKRNSDCGMSIVDCQSDECSEIRDSIFKILNDESAQYQNELLNVE